MTLMANWTAELWASLMPRRTEIKNNLSTELISMQVYDESFNFSDFNQHTTFEKWATITHFFTSLLPGCPIQIFYWTIDHILKYWVKSIKSTIRIPKKKYGYQSNLDKLLG